MVVPPVSTRETLQRSVSIQIPRSRAVASYRMVSLQRSLARISPFSRTAQVPRTVLVNREIQNTRLVQAQRQTERQIERQLQVQRAARGFTGFAPAGIFGGLPSIPRITQPTTGVSGGSTDFFKRLRSVFKYQPDITAVTFNIRGRRPKGISGILTGAEIRVL